MDPKIPGKIYQLEITSWSEFQNPFLKLNTQINPVDTESEIDHGRTIGFGEELGFGVCFSTGGVGGGLEAPATGKRRRWWR